MGPWGGILVYTYDIGGVVGVYTPVGVVTDKNLECTLQTGVYIPNFCLSRSREIGF